MICLFIPDNWSDITECQYGKRRPFIIGLGAIIIAGLSLLTFSPEIAESVGSKTIGLAIAITGSQLMDFALDTSETPSSRV